MKKFLSLLLSSAMVMSMSAANVMADDATEDTRTQINSIEADPEAIYFYNSAATDGEYLKSHCKITVDGVDITNDCHFRRISGDYLSNISKDSFSSGNFRECTVVLPPEGTEFAVNKPITIEVEDTNNIKGRSDSFMLYEYVNDDFENGLNWKSASGTAPTINTDAQGNKRLNLPKDATVVSNDYANQKDWTDYTISFDIIGGESEYTDTEVVRFIYNDSDTLKNRLDQTARGYAFNNGHTRMFYKSNGNGDSWGFNSSAGTYVAANATRHYKLNAQDGYMSARIKTDIGTQKFMDYKIPETHETKTAGAPTFVFCNSTGNAYLDNVRITKMIALDNVEEELTFSGINADTDGITVYANKAVDTKVMNELVTLKDENGTVIPTKVEKVVNHEGYKSEFVQNKPYIIKKADGNELAADTDYYLTIASGVVSNDEAAVSVSDVTKAFKLVDVLSDDFSGDLNWQLVHSNPSTDYWSNNTIEVKDGKLHIKLGDVNDPGEQRLVPLNYKDMFDLQDCTVKFDFNALDATYNGNWARFGFTKSEKADDIKDAHGEFHLQPTAIRIYVNAANNNWTYVTTDMATQIEDTYKFVGDGKEYSIYRNGVRVASRAEDDDAYKTQGAFAMLFWGNANTEYTLDNVKITRMTEIEKELKINTVEITADNASKDSVSGLTKANITAKIKNTVSQSQTATVILGVYDGVSNMTNVAVKENYNLTNGVNTVDFGEVEIKGGTQIKVFVFEDLTTLEPLCAHVEK